MLIGDLPTRAAKWYPEKEAIVFEEKRFTYQELNARVNALAHALMDMGVRKGDRIAVICHNSHYYSEVVFAAAKIGAVSTNLNWRLAPREIAFLIDDSEARVILFSRRFAHLFEPLLAQMNKEFTLIGIEGKLREDMLDYDELISRYPNHEPEADVHEDDIFMQLYTSGTTGRPKGVMLTHGNLIANSRNTIVELQLDRNCNLLGILPMFHIAISVVFTVVMIGAKVTFLHGFDLTAILETIEKERITALGFTPIMFLFLLEHPTIDQYDLSSVKDIIYATAPMPPDLLTRCMKKLNCNFIQFFGMTEMSPVMTMLVAEDHVLEGPEYKVRWLGSAGRPVMDVEVKIVDEEGNACPPGVTGEIIGRGPTVMKGYHKLPAETARAIRDGWYHTGDMGYFDDHGYLFIADRKTDMIISGGENIYPREVEEAILEMEGIMDVAVIGVPDDAWGEAVKAVIVKRPGSDVTEDEVIDHCKHCIASYKKPKTVDFVETMPRSAMGKILKHELRAKYWEGRTRKV